MADYQQRDDTQCEGDDAANGERHRIVEAANLAQRADPESGDAVADLIEGDQLADGRETCRVRRAGG